MAERWVALGVSLALAVSVAALFLAFTACRAPPQPPQPAKPKIVLVPVNYVIDSPQVDKTVSAL
ncbi:MAG: S49 family peptidase, partial [Pyrobaculum sp.]